MLARYDMSELLKTLKQILDEIHVTQKYEDQLYVDKNDEKAKKAFEQKERGDKSLLK